MLKKIVLFAVLLILVQNTHYALDDVEQSIEYQARKFKTILTILHKNYADSIDIGKASETAFKAMLNSLDKFSVYYTAEERQASKDRIEGSTVGIGIDLFRLDDTLIVSYVAKPSPADSAGILCGDKLLSLNGESTIGMTKKAALEETKGEAGEIVSLTVMRGTDRTPLKFKISRNKFPLKSIPTAFLIEGTDIGYIDCDRFSKQTYEEFKSSSDRLLKQGMKKLVIDLRANLGGSLQQVVNIAGELFTDGRKIAYTKGRVQKFEMEYISDGENTLLDIPLIIIIDNKSASASEALAGVVQDYDRGLVIGEQSFGKGSAQRIWDLKDGSAFKITTSKYYTPSGRCLHKPQAKKDSKLDPIIKKDIRSSEEKGRSVQLYRSEKGRPLIGGGGIIPDYLVAKDTTTMMTRILNKKKVFSAFAFKFLDVNRQALIDKYKDDYNLFLTNFVISEKMLQAFKKLSLANKAWNEQMYETDKDIIILLLKARLAYAMWGIDAFKSAQLQFDSVLERAVEMFPEAERMIK